jgi:hypothetical protein
MTRTVCLSSFGQSLDDLLQHHVGLGDIGRGRAVLLRQCRIADAEAGEQGDARDEMAAHVSLLCCQSRAVSTQTLGSPAAPREPQDC